MCSIYWLFTCPLSPANAWLFSSWEVLATIQQGSTWPFVSEARENASVTGERTTEALSEAVPGWSFGFWWEFSASEASGGVVSHSTGCRCHRETWSEALRGPRSSKCCAETVLGNKTKKCNAKVFQATIKKFLLLLLLLCLAFKSFIKALCM